MLQAIAKYRKTGGEILFNFVNFNIAMQLRQEFANAGMGDIPVEAGIARDIPIPKFQKD
jgi:hypothetical protein